MKISPFLLAAGALAAALYLLKKSGTGQSPADTTQPSDAAQFPGATQSSAAAQAPEVAEPVVNMVEETLHRHEGEDNPVVHAFEEAVSHTHEGA